MRIEMNKLLLIIGLLSLAACGTNKPITSYSEPPVVPIVVDPRAQQMSRNEVIHAVGDCESNGLRAVPIISKRMISGMLSDIVIDVQCMPRLRWFSN
jgi:predicted small lipoprotein YifL